MDTQKKKGDLARGVSSSSNYRNSIFAAIVIATVGLTFDISPWGTKLSKNIGLPFLYMVRGPRPAPEDVAIVSMSKRSIDRLGLPSNMSNWPRTLHANLINRLLEQGVAVIVFDVLFRQARTKNEDAKLAEAIARSGRTVLLQFVRRDMIFSKAKKPNNTIHLDRLISPTDDIAHGAAGLGPFPLPKVPAKVDEFWAFKRDIGITPTLPLVALQVQALQLPNFADFLETQGGFRASSAFSRYLSSKRQYSDLKTLMVSLRKIFLETTISIGAEEGKSDPRLSNENSRSQETKILNGLINAYQGANQYLLNFYGPAGTITTLPYERIMTSSNLPLDLKGKVVFIGLSELTSTDRKEGFYTVFSRDDGIDVSGVEIAATAFANLLHDQTIRPASFWSRVIILFAFGGAVFLFANLAPGFFSVGTTVGFGAVYFSIAEYVFAKHNLWLPITVPLIFQLPLAVGIGLLLHYGIARRLSQNLARGIRYYIPENFVHSLAHGEAPTVSTEIVEGVCLLTDLEGYTPLSESLPLQKLTPITTRYYDLVGRQIEICHGEVLRYTGDGMICAWTLPNFKSAGEMNRNACLAAIEIGNQIDRHNAENPAQTLSIRIGLHSGEFDMGIVGGGHHYEQSVLGPVVNTAARLESLNKILETRILASEPISVNSNEILFRPLGVFKLVGKSETDSIVEIMQKITDATPEQIDLCRSFKEVKSLIEARNWAKAISKLKNLRTNYPDDGPTKFLLERCERFQMEPPSGPVVIEMDEK